MAAIRAGDKFVVCDLDEDKSGFPNGWTAAVRDPDPSIIAKVYKKIEGAWVFQYNQGDAPPKQDLLVSGQNIKTLNNQSILGSGNINVGGGSFSGTMDDITDGSVYVKTRNNFTDAYKGKVDDAFTHSQADHAPADAVDQANAYTDTEVDSLLTLIAAKEDSGAAAAAQSAAQSYTDAEIVELKDGVAAEGNTLQKLYNLILGSFTEVTVADITERDAFDVPSLPLNVFVTDDGDGNWALYKATSTGTGASFVKLSDPDLLNAVMTAAQIKASYESNPDTNAFTNALLAKLNAIATGATANSTDAQLRDRSTHTGTQLANTISNFDAAAQAAAPAETAQSTGNIINGATQKSSPVDADRFGYMDSAAGNILKYFTWANLKTALNSLYQAVLVSGTNIKTINGSSLLGSGDLVIATPTPLILANNVSTAANTTPVNLTGMSFNYVAGGKYRIDIYGIVQAPAATTGHGFGVNCTTAPVSVCLGGGHQLANTGTGSNWSAIANNAIVGISSGLPSANTNVMSLGGGIIVMNATTGGTCQFIFRSETNAVTTCMANTLIMITRVA